MVWTQLRQLVGMSEVDDIWAGMAVWLLVIIAAVLALIQLGFLFRWAHRHIENNAEEDLRAKNMPFSMGNVIRIVFGYFLLPIVALSMFQLVVASKSPTYTVALAAVNAGVNYRIRYMASISHCVDKPRSSFTMTYRQFSYTDRYIIPIPITPHLSRSCQSR